MRNPRYDEILRGMNPGLERQVYSCLTHHVGRENAISRRNLIEAVFNKTVGVLANSSEDRQIREAISELQKSHLVISDSGKGGYYIPASMVEASAYQAEILSRARELESKARFINQLALAEFGQAQQVRLL